MTKRKTRVSTVDSNILAQEEYSSGKTKKKFSLHDLKTIHPKTENQRKAFDAWKDDKHLFMTGSAGTGKSLCGVFLGLSEVLNPETDYKKLIILRSTQPTHDIGYLPGDEHDKTAPFEDPYYYICDELFPWVNTYENLKKGGYVDFKSTFNLRGVTFNDAIVVVDETQNLTFQELDTAITRCGHNTRYIFCGDKLQSDMTKQADIKGYDKFMSIIERLSSFEIIKFQKEDVIRSGLVREYLTIKEEE